MENRSKCSILVTLALTTLLMGAFVINMSMASSILKIQVEWRPKEYTLDQLLPDPWKAVVYFRSLRVNASSIDPSTILLEGRYVPVSAPHLRLKELVLVVPFNGKDVLEALLLKSPHMSPGQYHIYLEITGRLYNGKLFQGSGAITLIIESLNI